MVVPLPVLIGAVGAVGSLVKETVSVVEAIRSGWRAKNEETKRQLIKTLADLQQNLERVGELALRAEGYFQTYENVLRLQLLCNRAEGFLKDNRNDCDDPTNQNYIGNWRVLETIFQAIESNRDAPMKVVMDRADWYDEKDKRQIERFLDDFSSAYQRSARHVENKIVTELSYELRGMTSALQQAETALRSTIYETILRKLQTLGK